MSNQAKLELAGHFGDQAMIDNDIELSGTNGYRSEIEKMQREVLDYLTSHAQTTAKAS